MKVLSRQRPTFILNTTNETFKIRYCVNLYLNWQRKYERSKLRVPFLLSKFRHLNFDLSYFRCQLRYRFIQYLISKVSLVMLRVKVGLWCDSTFILCYSTLKTAILLHKRGLVKTEVLSTVDGLHRHFPTCSQAVLCASTPKTKTSEYLDWKALGFLATFKLSENSKSHSTINCTSSKNTYFLKNWRA